MHLQKTFTFGGVINPVALRKAKMVHSRVKTVPVMIHEVAKDILTEADPGLHCLVDTIVYRHLLWIPRTILDQNFDLKNQCAYYMRTKYPGFFPPHPANVLIANFDDKHTGYIDSMFSCFGKNLKTGGIILILISSTVCLKYMENCPKHAFVDVFHETGN